ncbi:MAG: TRAP transporter large permease [Bacillota bacterium]|uniref:TRAP transporter large permease subunit n=1 Tax=Thermanaerosceptrum fracticalcis TaxID=1712410 RepID=A0A7G6E2L3_THEFR|nr:TRAP transporter large permease [Thermanaerosceptrum fracticalcis]QNB46317.1 TRAP transporter large permease subunit [Thermanaerosceptrum fracticalcis]
MTIALIILLLIFLVTSVPIFVALTFSTLLVMMFYTNIPPLMMVQRLFGGIDKFALMSMPFFILAADVMDVGGLSKRILRWARAIIGSVTGGLGMATELACMFFGALSGSSPATVIAVGKLMYPEMIKQKYPQGFAAGLITSSGSVALLIPPSITMIIYATVTGVSVGSLFIAGIGAGIVYGLMSMAYIYFYARRHQLPRDQWAGFGEIWAASKEASWALMVPVIIMGGIYGGIFTPTEAAGFSAIYAIFVSIFVYRELDLQGFFKVCIKSATTSAQVLVLVAAAQAFGWFLTIAQVPQMIMTKLITYASSPIILLMIINIVLLIAGMFVEGIASIIILTPLIYPVAVQMGIDPVHLGIVIVTNLCIGQFTPPFGLNLFVATGVTGLPMTKLIPGVMAFIIVSIIALLIITYIPGISLFLPKLVY